MVLPMKTQVVLSLIFQTIQAVVVQIHHKQPLLGLPLRLLLPLAWIASRLKPQLMELSTSMGKAAPLVTSALVLQALVTT
jgi:hypothetical protein